jgi:outer membrane protein
MVRAARFDEFAVPEVVMSLNASFAERFFRRLGVAAVALASIGAGPLAAQSLNEALANAYVSNPTLNAARAQLRVTNENVPQALSGYRPRVTATGDIGVQATRSRTTTGNTIDSTTYPRGVGIQVDQTLFNGFSTDNQVRQAESLVRAQRETLRTSEQDVLLAAATAYMDVVRDSAIVNLRNNFVGVINEQLRQTQDRFNVGEVTRTDVAQAEARLSLARADLELARANLVTSRATFIRVVGREPGRLNGNTTIERVLPRNLNQALTVGSAEHPQVRAAVYNVDSAAFAVNVAEAGLLPTVTLSGALTRSYERSTGVERSDAASLVARVTVPIYDGGVAPSRIRQAREQLGQRRIEIDSVRDQVRALVRANWGNLESARAQIQATQAQIRASEIALQGVREEARVGQRTTLDVLNAQQDLLNAQVTLVRNQRDRVVAAFALLGAVGRLNVAALGLNVPQHDPTAHYNQVRDRWHGLRTPSGE